MVDAKSKHEKQVVLLVSVLLKKKTVCFCTSIGEMFFIAIKANTIRFVPYNNTTWSQTKLIMVSNDNALCDIG